MHFISTEVVMVLQFCTHIKIPELPSWLAPVVSFFRRKCIARVFCLMMVAGCMPLGRCPAVTHACGLATATCCYTR